MENRKFSKSVIILFLLLVFGFTAVTFVWPERTFSENENRVLASAPEFSWESLFEGKFMSEYEKYITDQFFLRDEWIRIKTRTEMLLNKKDINGVYIGKDGYLIERHEDSKIDYEMLAKSKEYLQQFVERYAKRLGSGKVKVMLV